MSSNLYRPRLIDSIIKSRLQSAGAILIQGPKWCGKTTTAVQHAKSVLYFDEPDHLELNLQLAETHINVLLDGDTPHLIDEWQYAPQLWDAIRFTVDHRPGFGQFLLTGSAVPAERSKIHHSGAGRFAWITMRPMSLWESGESTGEISLANLFEGNHSAIGRNQWQLEDIAYFLCRGGWPATLAMDKAEALNISKEYITAIAENDISRADGIKRNTQVALKIMRSYARHQGSQATFSTIAEDLSVRKNPLVTNKTVARYLAALKKIFVVEDVPAWSTNLRSASVIRSTDTRYFIDPSIATAALQISPEKLMHDLNTFGLLFETMCMRDLRIYAQTLGANIYHYRDKDGLECDAVVEMSDGRFGLIEIKLGGATAISTACKSLHKLEDKIDINKVGKPSFRMVLTAVGAYALTLKDGTLVVPIGCLKD